MIEIKPSNGAAQKLGLQFVLFDTDLGRAIAYFYDEEPAHVAAKALNDNTRKMLKRIEQRIRTL